MKFLHIDGLPFLISEYDIEGELTYDEALEFISNFKNGGRLPNNDELKLIHSNKSKIPNLDMGNAYWSSENSTDPSPVYGKQGTAFSMTLYSGIFLNGGRGKRDKCRVRIIKDLN